MLDSVTLLWQNLKHWESVSRGREAPFRPERERASPAVFFFDDR
jgi:hypothetical protein